MDYEGTMTENYQNIIKKFKSLSMLGELITLILRILSQRIFSVYIGIVLVQFIVTTQMNFKTYCVAQSRFYIIMNFILIYLLSINFIQSSATQFQDIQNIFKDKYIIDYTKIGYPAEFLFRVISTFLMWRLYQFSKLKTFQYDDVLPNEELETSQYRHDRIHVRENQPNQGLGWGLSSSRNVNENSRNISHLDSASRSIHNPNQLRQGTFRSNQQDLNFNNDNSRRVLINQFNRQSGQLNNHNYMVNSNVRGQISIAESAQRNPQFSNQLPFNRPNIIQRPYTNINIQIPLGNQVFLNNRPIRT